MAAPNDFVALILTHGRADNVITYKTLRKRGYTGAIRLVIDDEDDQAQEYFAKFPGEVVQFHKAGVACDTYDNRKERRVILFARNAAFEIAEQLGFRYFIQLDDDYTDFQWLNDENNIYKHIPISNLDAVFCAMIEFMRDVPCKTIAMSQAGDMVGGVTGSNDRATKIRLMRKAMNSFICDTRDPFRFVGRINEDVNTYTTLGSRGVLFFSTTLLVLLQKCTQTNKGGMTGAYLDGGTYIKSFYSVIGMPSAVSVSMMNSKHPRMHHKIMWNNCVPKIINEKYKKQ